MDDLRVLEKINLLLIGLTSFNFKQSVPSDIGMHNQFIPADNLKSQNYLNTIKEWSDNQKMILNQKKTKSMIFNFTDNFQFNTRLSLNNENIEIVDNTKLLGVIVSNDLKWKKNTEYLVKKANNRLVLLRKVASFSKYREDLKNIYILYVRSILEQACVVWHSSLTQENSEDLERVQKSATKIIMGDKYENYEINLQTLYERRENLCLTFAKKCLENERYVSP